MFMSPMIIILSYLLIASSSECSSSVKNSVKFEELGGLYIRTACGGNHIKIKMSGGRIVL